MFNGFLDLLKLSAQMQEGFKRLRLSPPINFTEDDFDDLVESRCA
jgi:hypothetical protein